jgi:hypothetical protein
VSAGPQRREPHIIFLSLTLCVYQLAEVVGEMLGGIVVFLKLNITLTTEAEAVREGWKFGKQFKFKINVLIVQNQNV